MLINWALCPRRPFAGSYRGIGILSKIKGDIWIHRLSGGFSSGYFLHLKYIDFRVKITESEMQEGWIHWFEHLLVRDVA